VWTLENIYGCDVFLIILQVIVETLSEIGDPKDAICDATEKLQIDLLITGSHGYGMLKR